MKKKTPLLPLVGLEYYLSYTIKCNIIGENIEKRNNYNTYNKPLGACK